MSVVMYEEMCGVGLKFYVVVMLLLCMIGLGVGELEIIFYVEGVVMVNWNVVFRLGCLKIVNMWCEFGILNWE